MSDAGMLNFPQKANDVMPCRGEGEANRLWRAFVFRMQECGAKAGHKDRSVVTQCVDI